MPLRDYLGACRDAALWQCDPLRLPRLQTSISNLDRVPMVKRSMRQHCQVDAEPGGMPHGYKQEMSWRAAPHQRQEALPLLDDHSVLSLFVLELLPSLLSATRSLLPIQCTRTPRRRTCWRQFHHALRGSLGSTTTLILPSPCPHLRPVEERYHSGKGGPGLETNLFLSNAPSSHPAPLSSHSKRQAVYSIAMSWVILHCASRFVC